MSNIVTDTSSGPGQRNTPDVILKGVVGAILGAVAGYFLFVQLSSMGLYAFVLPGALIGIGCGWLAKTRSIVLMVVCFFLAIVTSTIGEWRSLHFVADPSLWFFVQHVHESRNGFAIIAIALNAVVAAWLCNRG